MSRSARLIVRIVLVPGGPGAADARRRIADVLLCAACAGAERSDTHAATTPANDPPPRPGEKAA